MLKQCITIGCLSVLAGCAASDTTVGDAPNADRTRAGDCIRRPSIRGYRVLDERNLIVDAAGSRKYLVVLRHRAYGINASWNIGFDSVGSRVCAGFSDVVYDGTFGDSRQGARDRVRIEAIRPLLPEEEEDLLIQYGLKEPEIQQMPEAQPVPGAVIEELDRVASD